MKITLINNSVLGKKKRQPASISSGSTSISTKQIKGILERLRTQRHQSTTQKTYYQVWKQFNKFYLRLDKKPTTWNQRLVLFVAYLIQDNKKSSTVKSYISAIKAVLLMDGHELNPNEYLLNSLTRACRLNNDRTITRLPIHKGMLGIILQRIQKMYNEANQPYLGLLFRTLLTTAYFGLFRACELTETSSGHAVRVKDVLIGTNKNKFLFVLHSSKTHGGESKPQLVKISSLDIQEKQNHTSYRKSN